MVDTKADTNGSVKEVAKAASEDVASPTENRLEDATVLKAYQEAGRAANLAICSLIERCVEDATILELCAAGDRYINQYLVEAPKPHGVAFPTAMSVNNCICHYSPIVEETTEKNIQKLKNGDVVKIEMGAHVNFYPSLVAFTVVVGATPENPCSGPTADVTAAAYFGCQAAVNALKPGSKNFDVTDAVQAACLKFGYKPVEDMLSYQVKRKMLDGPKQIIINPSEAQKQNIAKHDIETSEVYSIDILVSSGPGKARPGDAKTTIYKKTPTAFQLKMKTSRVVYSELTKRFDRMAFSLRNFNDPKKVRLGLLECIRHDMIMPYDVYYDKEGSVVSQFLFTVAVLPSGKPMRLTMGPPNFNPACWKTTTPMKGLELPDFNLEQDSQMTVKAVPPAASDDMSEDEGSKVTLTTTLRKKTTDPKGDKPITTIYDPAKAAALVMGETPSLNSKARPSRRGQKVHKESKDGKKESAKVNNRKDAKRGRTKRPQSSKSKEGAPEKPAEAATELKAETSEKPKQAGTKSKAGSTESPKNAAADAEPANPPRSKDTAKPAEAS